MVVMVVVLLLLLHALHLSISLVLCEQVFVGFVEVLGEGFFLAAAAPEKKESAGFSF